MSPFSWQDNTVPPSVTYPGGGDPAKPTPPPPKPGMPEIPQGGYTGTVTDPAGYGMLPGGWPTFKGKVVLPPGFVITAAGIVNAAGVVVLAGTYDPANVIVSNEIPMLGGKASFRWNGSVWAMSEVSPGANFGAFDPAYAGQYNPHAGRTVTRPDGTSHTIPEGPGVTPPGPPPTNYPAAWWQTAGADRTAADQTAADAAARPTPDEATALGGSDFHRVPAGDPSATMTVGGESFAPGPPPPAPPPAAPAGNALPVDVTQPLAGQALPPENVTNPNVPPTHEQWTTVPQGAQTAGGYGPEYGTSSTPASTTPLTEQEMALRNPVAYIQRAGGTAGGNATYNNAYAQALTNPSFYGDPATYASERARVESEHQAKQRAGQAEIDFYVTNVGTEPPARIKAAVEAARLKANTAAATTAWKEYDEKVKGVRYPNGAYPRPNATPDNRTQAEIDAAIAAVVKPTQTRPVEPPHSGGFPTMTPSPTPPVVSMPHWPDHPATPPVGDMPHWPEYPGARPRPPYSTLPVEPIRPRVRMPQLDMPRLPEGWRNY